MENKTEIKTIKLDLDSTIIEEEKNKIAIKATEDLLKSKIKIKDVFGNLDTNLAE